MNKVNIQCLYKIFEHSPVGIVIWCFEDPDDIANAHLKYCNKAAEKNTGYKLRNHIGKTMQQIFPDAIGTELTRSFIRALKSGVMQHLRGYKYADKNIAESYFDVTAQPLNHHLVMISYLKLDLKQKPLQDPLVCKSKKLRQSIAAEKTIV